MSSMIQAPPPQIQVGGDPGGDPGAGGPPPPDAGGDPHGAMAGVGSPGSENDSETVQHMKNALTEWLKAQQSEPDVEDSAAISKVAADMMKLIAANAKLVDTAMGAGPGAKMIRKAGGGPPPDTGGAGPGY